jgi:hypothetical protein
LNKRVTNITKRNELVVPFQEVAETYLRAYTLTYCGQHLEVTFPDGLPITERDYKLWTMSSEYPAIQD